MQKRHAFSELWATACLVAGFPCVALGWQPGTYPQAPARMHSSGFTVDTANRNDVVAFWHAVYQASEGYQDRVDWTGNYKGNNGKTSNAFVADVERRINYFRAMCGLPAIVGVNSGSTVLIESPDAYKPAASTPKSDAAQAAALMLIRNYDPATGSNPAITHDPAKSLVGWSTAAWNANTHGNLSFGIYGPGAITEYMIEELSAGSATSIWNTLVGHRRWICLPEATDFATGDQPGNSATTPPTNVLYISQKPDELNTAAAPGFVAYPPKGYFPAPINSRYWSLSRSGADFTSATVRMTDASGKSIAVSNIKREGAYGDPAIIWEVGAQASTKSVFQDTTFNVNVTGISGVGIPPSFNYSVTLINPDRITSNQSISGSRSPVSDQTTHYSFTPPSRAEAITMTAFRKRSTPWTAGAENPKDAPVIDHTAENYPLKASMSSFGPFGFVSGHQSFHLTFPVGYDLLVRGVPEQSFEVDRMIIAKSNARFQFLYRRGYMSQGSTLVVETSSNGGITWKKTGKSIVGSSSNRFDEKPTRVSINIPKSPTPVRFRFRYYAEPGAPIYTHEASPNSATGIFIDDITTENCDWLDPEKTTKLAKTATQFPFNASAAGGSLVKGSQWGLGLRTKLGGRWFPYGPIKTVTIK